MKSAKGSSIYEVLRTATRSGGESAPAAAAPTAPEPEAGAPTTLQERLAAYKAAKLAEVAPAAPVEASKPPQTAPVAASAPPAPKPVPAPLPATPVSTATPTPIFAGRGPGERVFRVTYNTAAFAVLVGIGLLFVAYAVGMQAGRSKASVEAPPDSLKPPPVARGTVDPAPPPPPPPAPKTYALLLTEWRARTREESVKAKIEAEGMRRALATAGLGQAEVAEVKRGAEDRVALYLGRYTNLNTDAVKKKFESAQKFKYKNATPFAKAEFEEVAAR